MDDMLQSLRGIRLGVEIKTCQKGHDVTKPGSVQIVKRKGRADSRQCVKCLEIRRKKGA